MSEKECQYDRIYEETIDFDRPQFVKELQMQINDNKKKDKEIERLNNIINGMEKYFNNSFKNEISVWELCLDKLKELKEGK